MDEFWTLMWLTDWVDNVACFLFFWLIYHIKMEDRSMKEEKKKKTKACKTETTSGIVFVFGKLSNPYII